MLPHTLKIVCHGSKAKYFPDMAIVFFNTNFLCENERKNVKVSLNKSHSLTFLQANAIFIHTTNIC